MWYIVIGILLLFGLFLAWRIASVSRGGRRRDERLWERLAPLARRLQAGESAPAEEVGALAARWELRPMLYAMLARLGRLDLLPASAATWEGQAEGLLAYWMMHPNELREAPAEIRCVERAHRDLDGQRATFFVLEYRMPPGHWAGDEPKLGVAGPFLEEATPYGGRATAFARAGDARGSADPGALVDRLARMVRARGA